MPAMMKLMITARPRVECRSLRTHREDARAHGDGHAHDGQIPPAKIPLERMSLFLCLRQRLLDGLRSKNLHDVPLYSHEQTHRSSVLLALCRFY